MYSSKELYSKIHELLTQGERFAVATIIRTEGSAPQGAASKMIITRDNRIYGTVGGGCLESFVVHEAQKVIKDGELRIINCDLGDDSWSGIGMACGGKVEIALELVEPQPRLIILGAGHIARILGKLAATAGLSLAIVDGMAKMEDFPEADIVIPKWYEAGLKEIPNVGPQDFIVILTRHKADEEALKAALQTPVKYIGLMGSRNRASLTFEALRKEGLDEATLKRVYTPIGLELGGKLPAEIAVSILAEIVMFKNKGPVASKVPREDVKSPLLAAHSQE